MVLEKIEIKNFRNLKEEKITFSKKTNYLIGENAQGKTNLLESIYLLCLLKSFRTSLDKEIIAFEKDFFLLHGTFNSVSKIERKISLYYNEIEGKRVVLDGKNIQQFSSLIGQFPVVIFSSKDLDIINGPPNERRKFFNIIISQCSNSYLTSLKEYDRILRQRNRILFSISHGKNITIDELESWNTQLIKNAEPLIIFREKFVKEINEIIINYYENIAHGEGRFYIKYDPDINSSNKEDIYITYQKILEKTYKQELQRSFTLHGPHRDDFIFMIGDKAIKNFGSRGEQKSAIVCLKAVECDLITQKLELTPIILLDDVCSELDNKREEKLIDLFYNKGQCFITGTSEDLLKNQNNGQGENKHFMVNNGKIIEKLNHDQ